MRSCLLASLALLAVLSGCRTGKGVYEIPKPEDATLRTTSLGKVVGGDGRYETHAWLGIPFAKPPVGPLRWKPPQPAEPWAGVRQATSFGRACAQLGSQLSGEGRDPEEVTGSEDCLTLNVWAPKMGADEAAAKKLPVMVWIHGGGNSIGSARTYELGHLASTQQVIAVSVQYRVGPLGWFRSRALTHAAGGDARAASGNFGTLDLIESLRWVRDNVAAFGGDPSNVTVFGESAGGINVFSLLMAEEAKGLFHRGISQSGFLSSFSPTDAEALVDDATPGDKNSSGEVVLRMLVADGRAKDREEAMVLYGAMGDEELERYLRSKEPVELLSAYEGRILGAMIIGPWILRDGSVLPSDDWRERLARPDGWNRVPMILGTNRDEMKLFLFFNPRLVTKRFWLLPRYIDRPSYLGLAEAMSLAWKYGGADAPAEAMKKSGAEDLFVYRFDWDEAPTVWGTDLSEMLGAAHGVEIPFVLGHWDMGQLNVLFTEENEPGRRALAASMASYWGAFARDGKPGTGNGKGPAWPAWGASPTFMVLDTPAGGGVRTQTGLLSRDAIVEGIEADVRLTSQKERCAVFRELLVFGRGLTREEYAKAGKAGCAEYPLEKYPWDEAK